MLRLFANAHYDFIAFRKRAYAVTALFIVPGLVWLMVHGLNYSIEFTGGTLVQIASQVPVDVSKLRSALDHEGVPGAEIQSFGADSEYVVRARLSKEAPDQDNTDATGAFHVTIPLGTYRFTTQPPPGSGLAGATTGLIQITGNTSLPPIIVHTGINLVLQLSDVNGPCANADLTMFDHVTGDKVVLVGNHSDATGVMSATIPQGIVDVRLEAAQGSAGAPLLVNNVPIIVPAFIPVVLPTKQVAVNVTGLGIQAAGQNGQIPVNVSLHNLQSTLANVQIDVVVRLSDGTELPVLPTIPLTLPPLLNLATGLMFVHVGTVPAADLGRTLQFTVRLRAAGTNTVLDEAHVDFVVY